MYVVVVWGIQYAAQKYSQIILEKYLEEQTAWFTRTVLLLIYPTKTLVSLKHNILQASVTCLNGLFSAALCDAAIISPNDE